MGYCSSRIERLSKLLTIKRCFEEKYDPKKIRFNSICTFRFFCCLADQIAERL
jgi:hypothetical protein